MVKPITFKNVDKYDNYINTTTALTTTFETGETSLVHNLNLICLKLVKLFQHGHRVPQSARVVDQVRGGEQLGVLCHLFH
jgi:hypothetical protein